MKKLNKVLVSALAIPALVAATPVFALTSCGNRKNHLTITDEQRVQYITGNTTFEVVFNSSFRIQNTDKFEIEVLDFESTKDATADFEYDETRTVVDEDGLKLVLNGRLSKTDGSPIENDTNIQFGLKISYSSDSTTKTWSETFNDFNITYVAQESNVEVVPGQENLFTQPGTDIQCLKFQLNGTHVSEDTSSIGVEAKMIEGQGVKGVEIVAPAFGHRVFDVDGDILYVWLRLIKDEDYNANDDIHAIFSVRLYCMESIKGVRTIVWDKTFDGSFKLTKNEGPGVLILPDERVDTGAGHDAGELKKTYRLFIDNADDKLRTKPTFEWTKSEGNLDISTVEAGNEYDFGGFKCRDVTITFTGEEEEKNNVTFSLEAKFDGGSEPIDIANDFLFTYISEKVDVSKIDNEDEPESKSSIYTLWTENYGMYNTYLMDNYDPIDPTSTNTIQYSIVPTGQHTDNITVENRRYNVILEKNTKLMQWDVMMKNTLLQKVLPKNSAEFNVIFTGLDASKNPIWKQQIKFEDTNKLFKLTKQATPLTPDDSMDQILDPTDPTGVYKLILGKAIETVSPTLSIDAEVTGQPIGKQFSIPHPTLKFAEGRHDAIIATLPLSLTSGGKIEDGDYVTFDLTIKSSEADYTWEQTLSGRMDVWGGFTLWRGVEVIVTAKEDKQWFLSSGENETINPGVVGGNSSKVTVDTSIWSKVTTVDWPENKQWKLCVPHEPEHEGMQNYYHFDESSIVIQRTRGTETTILTKDQYMVSSGGPILLNRGEVLEGDVFEFRVALAQGATVDKVTRFYFGYIAR